MRLGFFTGQIYSRVAGKMLTFVFVIAILSVSRECLGRVQEPSCSYLDNLEKILEKNVRNEHKLQIFGHTIKELEATLNEKLIELDKSEVARKQQLNDIIGNIDDMKDNLNEKSTVLQPKFEQMKKNLEEKEKEISQSLTDDLKKHEVALQAFQEAYKTPTVVFTAKYVSDKDVSLGKVINFTTIVSNVGGAYDTSTGKFTAPYDGLYLFHTTVCAGHQKYLYVHLIAAGTALSSSYMYNQNAGGSCTSISGMETLSKGDEAWVQGAYTATSALYSDTTHSWPSFSGMLIHT